MAASGGHEVPHARQVLTRDCSWQVADDLAVDVHGDGIRVVLVIRFGHQHGDDVPADLVADVRMRQMPQGGLVEAFAGHFQVFVSAKEEDRHRSGERALRCLDSSCRDTRP